MNQEESLAQETIEPLVQFTQAYVARLKQLLDAIDTSALSTLIQALEEARREDRTVFVLGNGGSAATASHMAQDLAFGTRVSGRRLRALSLADNVPFLTASANDIDYASVFEEQLRSALRPGDVVIAISASGNSPNVVRGIQFAKRQGALTVGLVGFDGGQLSELCDIVLHAQSEKGDYGPVEDLHLVLDHLIVGYLNARAAAGGTAQD